MIHPSLASVHVAATAHYSWILDGKPGLGLVSAALKKVSWGLGRRYDELGSQCSLRSGALTSLCDMSLWLRVLERSPVCWDEGRRRSSCDGTLMSTECTS